MEDKNMLPRSQRFVDIDNDVEFEMELSEDLIRIRDSRNNSIPQGLQEDHSGFVVLPTKIPLGVIIVFIVQCILTAVSLTSIYVEQKTTTAIQNEKISKLEENSYTKIEAVYLSREVENLKHKIERYNETSR